MSGHLPADQAPDAPGKLLARPPSPFEAIAAAKAERKLARASALAWLAATYPVAFGADAKPLALGVGRWFGLERSSRGSRAEPSMTR